MILKEPIGAMIALGKPWKPDPEKIFKHLGQHWPNVPKAKNVDSKNSALIFSWQGETASIALMPAPIPWSDLEGPCRTALHWPQAEQILKKHAAHLLIFLLGGSTKIVPRFIRLTQLTASTAHAARALGVYWPTGTVVQSARDFEEQAVDMTEENLPLTLWIDFRIQPEKRGRLSLFTTGLEALGHLEVELHDTSIPPARAFNIAYNTAHYLLDNGPVLKDGHTIGFEPDEKIRIRHAHSMWGRRKVIRLMV